MARERIPHPRPDREVELRSSGTSKAVTRKMTDEDWEKYGPLNTKSPRLINKTNEEVIEMKKELTKEVYLQERIKGKRNAQIEREYGLSPNSIYPIMKTWGLTAKEVNEIVAVAKNPPAPAKAAEERTVLPKVKDSAEVATHEPTGSFIAATIDRDQQILAKTAPRKSGRSMQIATVDISNVIETELMALTNYVEAMEGKTFRLEVSLVEVAANE